MCKVKMLLDQYEEVQCYFCGFTDYETNVCWVFNSTKVDYVPLCSCCQDRYAKEFEGGQDEI